MKRLSIVALAVVLLSAVFYIYECRNNDLRGWWKTSDDGKTYLVIEGLDRGSVTRFTLDGQPWPRQVGERGEIEPGCHDLDGIGFCVREGVEYHFDYWGP